MTGLFSPELGVIQKEQESVLGRNDPTMERVDKKNHSLETFHLTENISDLCFFHTKEQTFLVLNFVERLHWIQM